MAAKSGSDSALALARAIASGGNPAEHLTRWAREVTRDERREAYVAATADRKSKPDPATAAAEFDALEG